MIKIIWKYKNINYKKINLLFNSKSFYRKAHRRIMVTLWYIDGILPKGPFPQIGPFWQDTLDITLSTSQTLTHPVTGIQRSPTPPPPPTRKGSIRRSFHFVVTNFCGWTKSRVADALRRLGAHMTSIYLLVNNHGNYNNNNWILSTLFSFKVLDLYCDSCFLFVSVNTISSG